MLMHRNVIRSLGIAVNSKGSPQYAGIYVDPDTRECVATNGHMLVRATAPSGDDDPTDKVTGLLDADTLMALAKLTPRRVDKPEDAHVLVASPTAMSVNGTTKIAHDLQGQSYPAWKQVIPANPPADAITVTLSAKYLADLVKIAKAQGRSNPHVTFHVVADQAHKGVYFDVGAPIDSPKIDGVVMPMRAD